MESNLEVGLWQKFEFVLEIVENQLAKMRRVLDNSDFKKVFSNGGNLIRIYSLQYKFSSRTSTSEPLRGKNTY